MSGAPLAGGSAEYSRAVLNILDDFAQEKTRMREAQAAALNILDDFGTEQLRLKSTYQAMLNILDDANAEKKQLHSAQNAVINILDDLAGEKVRLEKMQGDVLRSEHAARASLKEKEALLKEVHHRVKNNLQVISSLLNLQARYLLDPAARAIFLDCQSRVLSIALVHEQLYRSDSLAQVNFGEYTSQLVDNLMHAHNADKRGIGRSLDVGNVQLPLDLAIPCGLMLNELVTNALKHAFPNRTGTMQIVLKESGPGHAELVVADDGIGLPEGLDVRHAPSLGLDLVFTFAGQLDATVGVTRQGGTRFRIRFPLPE